MTSTTSPANYPVRLTGELDANLSRWLWLVKMFLAIPHYVVLAFLWVAFLVTTVIAGFAILFTGRYPRSCHWRWRPQTGAQAVCDRRGEDVDLPSARPVGEFATDEGSDDDENGPDECAEEYLVRHIGLGAADLVQQVVGLVRGEEGVRQHE
jgi:hypothetical protein